MENRQGYVLTNKQARQLLLLKHGLIGDYKFSGEKGVCDYVRQVGCIQFDPIDVCGKNAELVLQSRIEGFSKEMLFKLLYTDRKLMDYFDKNMSIFSIDDWKYFSRHRAHYARATRSREEVDKVADEIIRIVQEKGFASSKDIDLKSKVDWAWSPTTLSRAALETLYFRGALILHHKKGAIKYYSYAGEYIAPEILKAEDPNLTREQHLDWWIARRIGAVGMLWDKPSDALLGIDGLRASERSSTFKRLFDENKIIKVEVEGIKEPFYCISQDKYLLDMVLKNREFKKRTELMAPLDNLLWDRKLINKIFGFQYKWEIYTPINQRKFGYYVLPVLNGEEFIGRIEVVNNKKAKELIVKNLWLEEDAEECGYYIEDIYKCLEKFKRFNDCDSIIIECEELKGKSSVD